MQARRPPQSQPARKISPADARAADVHPRPTAATPHSQRSRIQPTFSGLTHRRKGLKSSPIERVAQLVSNRLLIKWVQVRILRASPLIFSESIRMLCLYSGSYPVSAARFKLPSPEMPVSPSQPCHLPQSAPFQASGQVTSPRRKNHVPERHATPRSALLARLPSSE